MKHLSWKVNLNLKSQPQGVGRTDDVILSMDKIVNHRLNLG